MIKVNVSTNMTRKTVEIDESTTTIRSFMDQEHLDYGRFQFHIAGEAVTAGMLDKTFAENGYYDDVYLVSVTKTDSAC